MTRSRLAPVVLLATSALALAGCASTSADGGADDGVVQVVASTNVYGQIAEAIGGDAVEVTRSEEHTSELQSLMRISYAVFCLKKKKKKITKQKSNNSKHTSSK